MRFAAYMRISTHEQSTDSQRVAIEDFVARNYPGASVEWFEDRGVSGAKSERIALGVLRKNFKKFDAVICFKIDRMFRSMTHMIQLIQELESNKVTFISVQDRIDLSTPAGRLLFHILSAIGEFERDVIRERVNAGLRAARKRGVRLGARPTIVYDLENLRSLRAEGKTFKEISALTGISTERVWRFLRKA